MKFEIPATYPRIKQGILLFWMLWFCLATLTNFCDALKALQILPSRWPLASGNLTYLHQVMQSFDISANLTALLFCAILSWEIFCSYLFYCAWKSACLGQVQEQSSILQAFTASFVLWAVFMLADEIFILYPLEDTHRSYASFGLISLLSLHLLPKEYDNSL